MTHAILFGLCAAVLLSVGCMSTGVTDATDQDGPVFGPRKDTTFVAGTDGSTTGLGDLARVAKTIRKYKDLGADDRETIRRVAALKFDGLMASQMQRLAPAYERRKGAARRQTQARVATVRREATTGRKPAAVAEAEVTAAEAEQSREIAAIDAEWKSAARAEVVKTYGSDFAVPVRNPDGKAVVAFATVGESGISVSAAAYEVDGTATSLAAAAAAGREVSHQGQAYGLLDATVILK